MSFNQPRLYNNSRSFMVHKVGKKTLYCCPPSTLSSVMRMSRTRLRHPKNRRLVCFSSHRSFADDSVAKSLACSYLKETFVATDT